MDAPNALIVAQLEVMARELSKANEERAKESKKRDARDEDIGTVLKQIHELLESISTKQACMESRQCTRWGEATDAARMCDAHLRGQTALLSEAHTELLVREILREGSLKPLKYDELFATKDILRSQGLVAFYYETYNKPFENNPVTSYRAPEYSDYGSLSTKILLWRKIISRRAEEMGPEQALEMAKILEQHPIPDDVKRMSDLVYPVTPSFSPVTTPHTEVHERHEETKLEAANAIFAELSAEYQAYFNFVASTAPEWTDDKRMIVSVGLVMWMEYREQKYSEYKLVKDDEYAKDRTKFASGEDREWEMKKTKLASTLKRMFADHKDIEEKAEEIKKAKKDDE